MNYDYLQRLLICYLLLKEKGIPLIKEKLVSKIEIAEGEPIKLVAKVAGEPQPKIQWVKDNVPIKESENVQLTQKPDGTVALEINSAKESDSGKYELKVTNAKGTTISSSDVSISGKSLMLC